MEESSGATVAVPVASSDCPQSVLCRRDMGDVMGPRQQVTRDWENSNGLPGKFPALPFLLNHSDKEALSFLQQHRAGFALKVVMERKQHCVEMSAAKLEVQQSRSETGVYFFPPEQESKNTVKESLQGQEVSMRRSCCFPYTCTMGCTMLSKASLLNRGCDACGKPKPSAEGKFKLPCLPGSITQPKPSAPHSIGTRNRSFIREA